MLTDTVLERLKARFNNVKRLSTGGLTAQCPAHDDKHNSLSIGLGDDGRILLHCHAGCDINDIVKAAGISLADLAPQSTGFGVKSRKVVAEYFYRDLDGEVLYKVIRYEPKGFSQAKPDSMGGWISNVKDVKLVPYRLPEVIAAIQRGDLVYIVEGEKDVDNLLTRKITATTSPAGAGKWKPSYNEYFKNASVVIIPDNDDVGNKHSEQVANSLYGIAKDIKLVDLSLILPGIPYKGDISDYFAILGDEAGLKLLNEFVSNAKEWQPQVKTACSESKQISFDIVDARTLQEMDIPPIKFIVENVLSVGLHIIAGAPKLGKSWMVMWLCIQVARGLPVWGNKTLMGSTLYLALEDNNYRLKERMNKLLQGELAPKNFYYTLKAESLFEGLLDQIHNHMRSHPDTVLIAIDTFQKVRGIGSRDNQYGSDYRDASTLKEIADSYGIAILIVHHLRKMDDENDPFNRVSGTTGLTGAVDTVFVIAKDKHVDNQAMLYASGRDIELMEAIIQFDKLSCKWEMVSEDADSYRMIENLKNDALVIFLKGFINDKRTYWEGTASELFTEFVKAGIDDNADNYPAQPNIMGARLHALAELTSITNVKIGYIRVKNARKYTLTLVTADDKSLFVADNTQTEQYEQSMQFDDTGDNGDGNMLNSD